MEQFLLKNCDPPSANFDKEKLNIDKLNFTVKILSILR